MRRLASLALGILLSSNVACVWNGQSTEAVDDMVGALALDASSAPPVPRLLGPAPTPGPITTDGVNLYIGSGNNVLSMPIAGGSATALYPAATPCCVTGLTQAAGNVFWIDPNGDPDATAIFAGPSVGGTTPKVYSGFATGQPIVDGVAITTDGARLYAADEVNGNVVSMNLDGSGILPLVSRYDGFFSTEHRNGIAVANGTLYVADEGCDCSGGTEIPQIVSIPAGGGGFTTLFASPDFSVRPHDIAVVGGVLYFTDSVSDTIWQMPTSGGTPVPFISGSPFVQVSGINALGTTLYVTDSGAGSVYAIETRTASGCGVTVTGVKMFDSHTLEVDVTGQFSADPSSQKSLSVDMTLNGAALTSLFPIPPGSSGAQSKALFVDLAANHVPRFTDTMRFPVDAKMTENGESCSATANGIILLPTVIVPGILSPGILNSNGGDKTFPILEAKLTTVSFSSAVGEPYRLRNSPSGGLGSCASTGFDEYPTLYTLSYRTSKASFAEGAVDLTTCVRDVKSLTYADQVNIVTHSKGGLVARQYLSVERSLTVHALIMAQPPNLGAIPANWFTLVAPVVVDFRNLQPLWNWKRANDKHPFHSTPNEELARLNERAMPSGVLYTIIYSTSISTLITQTGKLPDVSTVLPGDLVVPAFSQRGLQVDPNDLTQPQPLIPAFDGVPIRLVEIPGIHRDYLESQPVMAEIVRELVP